MAVEKDGLFVCGLCGLKYADRKTAEECEAWDKEHDSCNLDISKKAVK